ncbi:MAG: HU family DNA-binding protein, partial [Duncaniella sp.]|nr:HU family DNA-binding protein [Duncaniella sp.]
MNRKIPFQELAAALSERAGVPREEAEAFAKGFFDLIASGLTEGETVTVAGLGTFAPTEDENGVGFTPDPELAEALNAPFALFEPEEVADDITEETLAEAVAPAEEPTEEPVENPTEETPE